MPYQKYFTNLRFTFVILLLLFICTNLGFCQTELTLPTEFQNLPLNTKALEKNFSFTVDSNTAGTAQNFILDKTGFILHLVPSPKIKDSNTKLRIFSNDGIELQTYKFIDDTIFALADPLKTYSIFEEITPDCNNLTTIFGLDPSSTICPNSELFKLNENLMITKDTSFKISLRAPADYFSLALSLPNDTQFSQQEDFSNIKVSIGDISSLSNSGVEVNRPSVNIANLLNLGNLCLVSKKKTASKTEITNCSFINNNVNSIISFKNSLIATPSKVIITVSGIPTGTNTFILETPFDNAILKLNGASTDNGNVTFLNADSNKIEIFSDMNLPATVKLAIDLTGIKTGTSPISVGNIILGTNGAAITGAMAAIDISSIAVALSPTSTYFTDKDISMGVINALFPFIHGRFNTTLSHNCIFEYEENFKSSNAAIEITNSSPEKYFFENNSSNFSINLGEILPIAKKNKKNVFTLNNPIEINKTLNDISFSIPLDKAESLVTLTSLNNMNFDIFFSNLSLNGIESPSNSYKLSTNNNIIIKNLPESDTTTNNKTRLQTTPTNSLIVSSYLPEKLSSLIVNRDYTFVEQFTAPSVDEKSGKAVEVINNKSRADLTLSKSFLNLDLLNQPNSFTLALEKPSVLLNNKSFTKQGSISGFLLPPDSRPVIEADYRATIKFTTATNLNLSNSETLKIIYADLKTRNETPLTNFFSFSYLPFGTYNVNLRFDSDRTKLFQNADLMKQLKQNK